jgi:quercetin dioxygenase-like cupin family protein
MNRRELCSLLPILALAAAQAQEEKALTSAAFPFEDLKAQPAKGHTTRPITKGKTPTGERLEVHETTLDPGAMPHPPHRHVHSEFWLIREGTVEITVNGESHRIGPGSAAFAASNDLHGIKNVGDQAAQYFVVEIGIRS